MCLLCMEKSFEPKLLRCNHFYCKACIEKSMTFNIEDESFFIKCPLNECAVQTTISSTETANDLNDSKLVESVEREEAEEISLPTCDYNDECNESVSFHCCAHNMCVSCMNKHEQSTTDVDKVHKKVQLLYCVRELRMRGWCSQHNTWLTHVCSCKDTALLCVYCAHTHPLHKRHSKTSIKEESEAIRNAILEDMRRREKFVEACRMETKAHIPIAREKLQSLLKKRKEECMAQYVAQLNEEEEKIRSKFNDICGHLQRIAELSIREDTNGTG